MARLTQDEIKQWDRCILGALKTPRKFADICTYLGIDRTKTGPSPAWRIIDRRLQALRKAGRVVCNGGEWAVTP